MKLVFCLLKASIVCLLFSFNVSSVSSLTPCSSISSTFRPSGDDFLACWIPGEDNSTIFEISRKVVVGEYLALGLSLDDHMGNDDALICLKDSTQNNAYITKRFLTTGHSGCTIHKDQSPIKHISSDYKNGLLTCIFSFKINSIDSSRSDYNYYLLLAVGKGTDTTVEEHSKKSVSNKIDLNALATDNFGSSSSKTSLKIAHGILMVVAWLIFASSGLLMPRYLKQSWHQKKPIQKPLWFTVHILFMMLVLGLTICGFVIIFVYAKEYVNDIEPPGDAHPVLGIITMILVLANPIMAAFRCGPDAPTRWVFNLFHFLVGQGAYIFAMITIYLAMRMSEIILPYWCLWVLVAHTCWQALVEIILNAYARYLKHNVSNKRFESGQGNEMAIAMDPDENNGSAFNTIIVIVHFLVVVAFGIAISVGIGQSAS